jgi:hypothetical protein
VGQFEKVPLCLCRYATRPRGSCSTREAVTATSPGGSALNSRTRDDPVVVTDPGGVGRRSNIMSALGYAGGRCGGQPDERRIA